MQLLIIPMIIGVIVGAIMVFYPEPEQNSEMLTKIKLIQDG